MNAINHFDKKKTNVDLKDKNKFGNSNNTILLGSQLYTINNIENTKVKLIWKLD